jgi:hypothetical protein
MGEIDGYFPIDYDPTDEPDELDRCHHGIGLDEYCEACEEESEQE